MIATYPTQVSFQILDESQHLLNLVRKGGEADIEYVERARDILEVIIRESQNARKISVAQAKKNR